MSVSLDHELMVLHLIQWLDQNGKQFHPQTVSTECSLYPKCKTAPPIINGHRPDLYVISKLRKISCLIGEAKTTKDLETYRTEIQLRSFVQHLIELGRGHIVLGVTWNNIANARSILRKIISSENAGGVSALVIDCSVSLLRREH